MNAATATAAAPAPNAAAPAEKNQWLRCASVTDLDAYIKSAKIGRARADEMRSRWREAHPVAVAAPAEAAPQPLFQAEDAKAVAAAAEDMAQGLAAAAKKKKKVDPGLIAAIGERMKVINAAPAPAPGLVTRYIDPGMIDVQDGWNARVDFGDLDELVNSIKSQKRLDGHGLINDIRVKEKADGRYALIDGERRYLAVLELIAQGEVFDFGIPAKVESAEATDADLIIKMFTANTGKPFLPYEEAMYYKRLRESGMTIAQIEEKTGRSDNSIVGALALLEADEDLVDAVVKGQIGATMGKSIAVNVRGNKTRQKELVAAAKTAKKSGDKAAMKKVQKDIDEERRAKAAKKMPKKQLKARKADEHEIATMGTERAARLKDLMEDIGLALDTDLVEWVSNDRELQIAANFGALLALRSIMGDKTAKLGEL